MSQRDFNYFPEDVNPRERDEEDEEGDDDEVIDVDTPEEDFEEDHDGEDNDTDEGTTLDSIPNEEDVVDGPIEEEEEEEEDDADALTWESSSTISDPDETPDHDEWYPMTERKSQIPNFALPTSTRSALNTLQQMLANARSLSPTTDDDVLSDREDVEFQSYKEVMRPAPTRKELSQMVLDYFLHYGHSEMIETFCTEANLELPVEEIKEMNVRNEVRDAILAGQMEVAIEKMNAISPKLITEDRINFVVRKQHIIEMIRAGMTTEPVEYFRAHLLIDGKRPCDERMEILEKIFTLMVFAPEDNSEFHVYYEQKEREITAREVNSALLGALGRPKSSRIDMLAKSIVWVRSEVMNTINPQSKTSPTALADKYFSKPFGYNELVEMTIKTDPLDMSLDYC